MKNNPEFIIHNSEFKRGQILVITVIFLAVILILSTSLFTRVTAFLKFGSNSIMREQAINLAEAAIDKTVWQLNQTGGTYTGEADTAVGTTGTFTVTVTDKSPGIKTITATGFVPNSAAPKEKQVIKVDTSISGETISFRYAIQVGTGGLTMANSSQVNGTVYSNANVTGSGSATIAGDAYAVGTISSPRPIITGTKHPSSPPSVMPTVDYQYWKDQAAAVPDNITTCSPTCTISSDTSIGPHKYIGNLNISNNAHVTIDGPIWVTGDVNITQGGTQVILNPSFGSEGTVFIADGKIEIEQGGSFIPTNADPKGYILVVTTSTSSEAIEIANSAASAIFYALDGGAQLSQSAHVSALVAKSLSMQNTASLDYDQGLASADFSSGPGGSWAIKKGTYHFK